MFLLCWAEGLKSLNASLNDTTLADCKVLFIDQCCIMIIMLYRCPYTIHQHISYNSHTYTPIIWSMYVEMLVPYYAAVRLPYKCQRDLIALCTDITTVTRKCLIIFLKYHNSQNLQPYRKSACKMHQNEYKQAYVWSSGS